MTSSIEPAIAWPIYVFMAAVFVFRFCYYLEVRSERRITEALGLALIICGLREPFVQQQLQLLGLDVGLTRQLSTTVIVLMMAPFLLLALSWSMVRQEPRWLARVVWSVAALCMPVMLILGSDARHLNQYIDRTRGWPTIAYFSIFALFVISAAIPALRTVSCEIRRGNLSPRNWWTYLAVGLISFWASEEAVSIVVSGILASQGFGSSVVEFRIMLNQSNFGLMAAVGACCASLKIWAALGVRLGLDKATRTICKIEPMWSDLIAGCPEIPLLLESYAPSRAVGSRRRLHRMTIEIRDSLLIVNRWVEPCDPRLKDKPEIDWYAKAVEIQRALTAKKSGLLSTNYQSIRAVGPQGLREETRDLALLAAQWSITR